MLLFNVLHPTPRIVTCVDIPESSACGLLYPPSARGLEAPTMFIQLLQKELSIDDYVDHEEECRLGALLADPKSDSQEKRLYDKEVSSLVHQALVNLDDRELHIIRNRFGLLGGNELTLEEIGKSLNLSRERVRQLEREAKDKLRANLVRHRANLRFSLA
jgi:RNA polymerase primary sigma factor